MRKTLPHVRLLRQVGSLQRQFEIVPATGAPVDLAMAAMVGQYMDWCRASGRGRDCSGALQDGTYLDDSGKYKVAFDIALGAQWSGFADELRDMADPTKVKVVLLSAMVGYMLMLVFPGIVTQAFAAAATVVLTAYLGAQTVWNLVAGWVQMVREANAATTFGQLRAAGERYGRLVGAQTARVLVMVVTAMIAEGGLMARALGLPKAAQASAALAAEAGGMGLAALGEVSGTAVAASGVTVVLAPAAAIGQVVGMAMAARGTAGAMADEGCEDKADWHHIATVENSKAVVRGGPWTPRFKALFDRVGLSMESSANKVRVQAHRGPHPEAYHRVVYDELDRVFKTCRSAAVCREKFIATLQRLANEVSTVGTDLNQLVTRGCGR